MMRPYLVLATVSYFSIGLSTSLSAQDSSLSTLELNEMAHIADIAHDGSDPRITASRVDEGVRRADGSVQDWFTILISVEGRPSFIYERGHFSQFSDGRPDFVMSCRGDGIIDISAVVRHRSSGGSVDLGANDEYALIIRPYGQDLTFTLPVELGETIPYHDLLVRVAGSARADDAFFTSLRGTTNFAYQLTQNGAYVPLSRGVDFSTFREDIAPLLEHCRNGHANPLDAIILSEIIIAEEKHASPDDADEIDLALMENSHGGAFRRLYEGRRSPVDTLHPRMTTYLAFHLGYWQSCAQTTDVQMDFYTTTPLAEIQTIGVASEDYAPFVLTASTFEQVNRAIYDSDFGAELPFHVVMQRLNENLVQRTSDWSRIFSDYGCSGATFERFQRNIRNDLPWFGHSDGSSRVEVDFGGRQFDVQTARPINIEIERSAGAAMAGTGANDLFASEHADFLSNYPGQVLHSIALGNFALVERIEDNYIAFASNPGGIADAFGIEPDNIITQGLEAAMRTENALRRQSNLIAAYAIGRTHILGACGDLTTHYREDRVYWTEYRNGLGQYVSSSSERRSTTFGEVPSKFDAVIQMQNSISSSSLLQREMATIINRMNCDSPARLQLEDNMLAYFNGRAPEHIRPIPEN